MEIYLLGRHRAVRGMLLWSSVLSSRDALRQGVCITLYCRRDSRRGQAGLDADRNLTIGRDVRTIHICQVIRIHSATWRLACEVSPTLAHCPPPGDLVGDAALCRARRRNHFDIHDWASAGRFTAISLGKQRGSHQRRWSHRVARRRSVRIRRCGREIEKIRQARARRC